MGIARGAVRVSLLVELDHVPGAADLAALRAKGAAPVLRADGSPLIRRRVVVVDADAGSVSALAAVPGVRNVTLDGGVVPHPRPLDVTTELMHAPQVHRLRNQAGMDLTGQGMTICDVDSGIDVFHPLFFRADGGTFDWIDSDGDGVFTPGVDQVDVGAGAVMVEFTDAVKGERSGEVEDADGVYQLEDDFLYADDNANGARDFGKDAGFDSTSPSLGERWLLPDDVNDNGKLDVGERLIALGTSKIAAFRLNGFTFRRGENLINAPYKEAMSHGTGASGVLVAGVRGLTKLVGVAPEADLIMATSDQGDNELQLTDWCIGEGARVVLHEYAPWVGYHLDGSSEMEALIDDTSAQGVSHINPAGNLSTARKLAKLTIPAGETTTLPINVPEGSGIQVMGLSLLWRTPSRDLELELVSPSGQASAVLTRSATPQETDFGDDFTIYNQRVDSSRGTALTTGYLFASSGAGALETGDYTLRITDPAATSAQDVELFAYVFDEVSGWGVGAAFTEHVSEDHLVGYPGTADHGMGIAAYVGRGEVEYWGEPGQRAGYSGRGHRIDGERALWISGPADPWTAGHLDGYPVSYFLYGGTSGASPHVAGAAALLLQSEPDLTGDDVRQRLADTAITDSFTGAVPNDDFGFGKVDAYRAVTGEAPPDGASPIVAEGVFEVTVGVDSPITLVLSDAEEAAEMLGLSIDVDYDGTYDADGVGPNATVRVATAGEHIAKARVRDATGRTGQALIKLVASEPIDPPGTGGSDAAAGAGGIDAASSGSDAAEDDDRGCDCRTAGRSNGGASAVALAAVALAVARIRRRPRAR